MSRRLKLYRPSNGTEGMGFMECFCEECVHDWAFQRGVSDTGCDIVARALMYDVEHDRYPREWTYDADNRPTCTAFKQRPDNGDEDPPPAPPPPDPTQLVLIADPTEDAAVFANAPEIPSFEEAVA